VTALRRERRKALPFVVVWAIFIAYILAARGIRNFFPISSFGMYQAQSSTMASRVLVVDSQGKPSEITQYGAFQCNPLKPNLADVAHCEHSDIGRVAYVARDLQIHLDEHLIQDMHDGVEAKLVWRTFLLEDRPGPPAHKDCVLAVCQVRRKGEGP
jgi:hypothetical protein